MVVDWEGEREADSGILKRSGSRAVQHLHKSIRKWVVKQLLTYFRSFKLLLNSKKKNYCV